MAAPEVEAFLTHLARHRKVAPTTQSQAFNALVFFYRNVLNVDLEGIDALRAKECKKIPVVLRADECGKFWHYMLLDGVDLRSIQEFVGYATVTTTENYTHAVNAMQGKLRSPFDDL